MNDKGKELIRKIEDNPVIAAVKDEEGLKLSLTSDVNVIFVLFGDICTIPSLVKRVKTSGKMAMVHMDLIAGLSAKDVSVEFIRRNTMADGIISTKTGLIDKARELGMATVLRYFVIDSMALASIEKQGRQPMNRQPDLVEILPGVVLPKTMEKIRSLSRVPISAGGLIQDREDVLNALNHGCTAISTTSHKVWFL